MDATVLKSGKTDFKPELEVKKATLYQLRNNPLHMKHGHTLFHKTITTVCEGADLPQLNSKVDFSVCLLQ